MSNVRFRCIALRFQLADARYHSFKPLRKGVRELSGQIMKIRMLLIAACAIVSACGSSSSQQNNADQPSTTSSVSPSVAAARATPQHLRQQLEACEAEAGCDTRKTRKALWAKGYCRTSSEGTVSKCTDEEVADDRSTTIAAENQ